MVHMQPRMAYGGVHVQGVKLGIVLLPSTTPKILGDLAHAGTWRFPVRLQCTDTINNTQNNMYQALVTQAKDLISDGCSAIATNYRFLCPRQVDFATAVGVPCITSALYQYSMIRSVLPHNKTIAIMTTDMDTLGADMLESLNIPPNIPVVPVDTAGDDIQQAVTNVVKTANNMCQKDIGAILMESNGLSTYSHVVHHHTGVPVYDVYSLIDWFGNSLQPKNFGIPYTHGESHV